MTPDEADVTPEQERQVSELLAGLSAEVGGQVPPDVARRLDDTLAGLVAERGASTGAAGSAGATGAAGAAAGRRRWPRLVLAAAAVVLGGFAVNTALDRSGSGEASSSGGAGVSSLDRAEGGGDAADGGGTAAQPPEMGPEPSGAPSRGTEKDSVPLSSAQYADGAAVLAAGVPSLAPDRLRAGVRSVLAELEQPDALSGSVDTACTRPRLEAADAWLLVRFDGDSATLVLAPRSGGRVSATVYSCADAQSVGAVTVRRP